MKMYEMYDVCVLVLCVCVLSSSVCACLSLCESNNHTMNTEANYSSCLIDISIATEQQPQREKQILSALIELIKVENRPRIVCVLLLLLLLLLRTSNDWDRFSFTFHTRNFFFLFYFRLDVAVAVAYGAASGAAYCLRCQLWTNDKILYVDRWTELLHCFPVSLC